MTRADTEPPVTVPRFRWVPWLLVGITVSSTTLSQVALKYAASHSAAPWRGISTLANPWLWAALALYALAMLCWLFALRRLRLSQAYPWTALVYVGTPLAGAYLFGETLTLRYFAGIACICIGIAWCARAATEPAP